VRADGLRYPVAQDNRFTVWRAFQNRFWPAKYLIDARGHLRYVHFGEGGYERTEQAIRSLLRDAGAPAVGRSEAAAGVRAPHAAAGVTTPETYVGAERASGWVQDPLRPGARDFGRPPARLARDRFALGGRWTVGATSAEAGPGARIAAEVGARRVFLVLGGHGTVRVGLDGRPHRTVRVDRERLYTLVDLPRVGMHRLDLRLSTGLRAYAFTFG
jgi:hypothetical protein